MQYLKQCGIIHGDLKAVILNFFICVYDSHQFTQQNVLVDSKMTAHLADFEVSSFAKPATPTMNHRPDYSKQDIVSPPSSVSGGGTPRYIAPEHLLRDVFGLESRRATFESDIYSLAMLIYEV
jgi:serine/threonine protein kinase